MNITGNQGLNQMDLSDLLSTIVSIAALLFVVFSFWWMYWRRGHLIVSTPLSYIAAKTNNTGLLVELPLSFYNTGALPIIVDNLYLIINQKSSQIELYINATRDHLGAKEQKPVTQFVVDGGKTTMNIFSFLVSDRLIEVDKGEWDCHLFGKLNSKKYKSLLKFKLYVKYFDGSAIVRLNFDDEYRKLVKRP